jgi:hypothetical protein
VEIIPAATASRRVRGLWPDFHACGSNAFSFFVLCPDTNPRTVFNQALRTPVATGGRRP